MAQQRGAVIEPRLEPRCGDPPVHGRRERAARGADQPRLQRSRRDARRRTLTLRTACAETGRTTRRVFVEVTDTGVGMDEETRRRCLEPFFTTKGERGTGLGLAMVYGIAQRHGVDIDIESAPARGTTSG